jgi:RNA:NAD 2'-phosphotransferase (TPT1/KptA family)
VINWLRTVRRLRATAEQIAEAIRVNNKQRFQIQTTDRGTQEVRALQGHSVTLDINAQEKLTLHQAKQLSACVHGTFDNHIENIMREGLIPGGLKRQRADTHFCSCDPFITQPESGVPPRANRFLYIDIIRAIQDGHVFRISPNGVILAREILPPIYITKIVDNTGAIIHPAPPTTPAQHATPAAPTQTTKARTPVLLVPRHGSEPPPTATHNKRNTTDTATARWTTNTKTNKWVCQPDQWRDRGPTLHDATKTLPGQLALLKHIRDLLPISDHLNVDIAAIHLRDLDWARVVATLYPDTLKPHRPDPGQPGSWE